MKYITKKIMNKVITILKRGMLMIFYMVVWPRKIIFFIHTLYIQPRAFKNNKYDTRDGLVMFFIPEFKQVSGGDLQIFSLNRMTREYFNDRNIGSFICWLPGKARYYHRFDGFNNDEVIFPLEMILKKCKKNCQLLFHVPEFATEQFYAYFGDERLKELKEKHGLRINIMNQNIDLMPSPLIIKKILSAISNVTCTVGNPAWVTEEEQLRLGVPLYPLPTWYYPDDAPWQPYESKKNLLIVSKDYAPEKEGIIKVIEKSIPNLEIKEIRNMKYEEYLEYEKNAKWSITFGEGLDGYFYGPVLRGGVSFAVKNNTFNHPGLKSLKTVYPGYEEMALNIVEDILALDNKESYEDYNNSIRLPLEKIVGREKTWLALGNYYANEYVH